MHCTRSDLPFRRGVSGRVLIAASRVCPGPAVLRQRDDCLKREIPDRLAGMNSVSSATVLVTGPTGGLGKAATLAIANRPTQQRPDLVLVGRPGQGLAEVADAAPRDDGSRICWRLVRCAHCARS
jgi:hypothetical protein